MTQWLYIFRAKSIIWSPFLYSYLLQEAGVPNLILLILTVYRQVDRVKSSECPLHLYSAGVCLGKSAFESCSQSYRRQKSAEEFKPSPSCWVVKRFLKTWPFGLYCELLQKRSPPVSLSHRLSAMLRYFAFLDKCQLSQKHLEYKEHVFIPISNTLQKWMLPIFISGSSLKYSVTSKWSHYYT